MKLTPEVIAALEAALGGPGNSPNPEHPDAPQDYEMICQVIEEKLAPSFMMIGQQLQAAKDRIDNLEDILYKLITTFDGAVSERRMGSIKETVLPKYSADLGAIGPMAKDLMGKDIEAELLEALMSGDGDPDEIAMGIIGPYKEKFGKYLGGAPAPGKEPEANPEAQGTLDLEPPAATATEPEDKKEEKKPARASDNLIEQLTSLGRKTA